MITHDDLRAIPLFAELSDEQLDWVAALGREEQYASGDYIFREGGGDVGFFVILDGLVQLTKQMGSDEMMLTQHRGGSFSGEVPLLTGTSYIATLQALEPSRILHYDNDEFQKLLSKCPGFATTVLRELAQRLKSMSAMWSQHEKLVSLGTIAAGLAHELNNPAAAIQRAAAQLDELQADARAAVQELCAFGIDPSILKKLGGWKPDPAAAALDTLELSDLEERLAYWLEDQGVAEAWELAPALAGAGIDQAALGPMIEAVPAPGRGPLLRWFAASLMTAGLTDEINDSATRISDLVASVKQYSFTANAPQHAVDIHKALEKSLKVIGPELAGIEVIRDYDKQLPAIEAYGSELSQVWTNLIDNAVDAMAGSGRLTIRTRRELDRVLVEIIDTGPGIPDAIVRRVFEPFFTTKGAGQGSGLGLDICYRIVVGRHGGDLRVDSKPGATRFQVRLPIRSRQQGHLVSREELPNGHADDQAPAPAENGRVLDTVPR